MKRVVTVLLACVVAVPALAQATSQATKSFLDDPFHHPMLPFYLVIGLIAVVTALVFAVAVYMIRMLNLLTEQAHKEKAAKLGVVYTPSPGWWDRFSQKMNASVPVEQEKNIELDHSYDGIKELDNPLSRRKILSSITATMESKNSIITCHPGGSGYSTEPSHGQWSISSCSIYRIRCRYNWTNTKTKLLRQKKHRANTKHLNLHR
jgi:hypothetical protein